MNADFLKDIPLKTRSTNQQIEIYDGIRKKFVKLTPEEFVRQKILYFLLIKGYPAGLIAVEYSLVLNNTLKRADIVVFDKEAQPLFVIECKSHTVSLDNSTIEQIRRYNMTLNAPLLGICNGLEFFIYYKNEKAINFWPTYDEALFILASGK